MNKSLNLFTRYTSLFHPCGILSNCQQNMEKIKARRTKVPCEQCGKEIRISSMGLHLARHASPKATCSMCGKQIQIAVTSWLNNQHRINVHLRNRPFLCRYGCDFRYNDSSNRNSHERKKHGGLFNKQIVSSVSVIPTE